MTDWTTWRLLVAGAAFLAAVPASAAPYVAGTYYEDAFTINCGGKACTGRFAATPAAKFLTVKRLNCSIPLAGIVGDIGFVVAATSTGPAVRRTILDYRLRPQGGAYVIDQEMQFKVPARSYLRVEISSGAATALCVLTGELSAT